MVSWSRRGPDHLLGKLYAAPVNLPERDHLQGWSFAELGACVYEGVSGEY